LIELLVVMAVLATLLAIAAPRYIGSVDKAREATLRENLATLCEVVDKHYADTGKYPTSLEDLVAKHYLRAIPKDPFTQSAATWVAVPPQDARKGNVWDVKSGAKGYERY
jgi:general secretion pathway protein G